MIVYSTHKDHDLDKLEPSYSVDTFIKVTALLGDCFLKVFLHIFFCKNSI